jgi:ABC-type antimicrobial peptide transport system permease subunit
MTLSLTPALVLAAFPTGPASLPSKLIGVILRGAMIPLAAGLAVSLVAALLLSRLLTSVLYEISGTDPLAYISAAALFLAIGAVASARPAWKAATVDPMHTLRAE